MEQRLVYQTKGVCSRSITVTLRDGVVEDVNFLGGCAGNTTGVSQLVRGMRAEEAIRRLRGIRCGARPTSCPDQLAHALEECLQQSACASDDQK